MTIEEEDELDIEHNDLVLSLTKPVGKHSFVDDRQKYNKAAPPPRYLYNEKFLNHFKLPTEFDEIFFGLS